MGVGPVSREPWKFIFESSKSWKKSINRIFELLHILNRQDEIMNNEFLHRLCWNRSNDAGTTSKSLFWCILRSLLQLNVSPHLQFPRTRQSFAKTKAITSIRFRIQLKPSTNILVLNLHETPFHPSFHWDMFCDYLSLGALGFPYDISNLISQSYYPYIASQEHIRYYQEDGK